MCLLFNVYFIMIIAKGLGDFDFDLESENNQCMSLFYNC